MCIVTDRKPEEAEVLDLARFSTEFSGESDRGAVLVAASRLDEVLKGILLAYVIDTKSASDLLDGFNAPLGTFSARAAACHAMGLIDDAEFSDISRIRKIRNTFGHHWKDIDFDRPEVADVARELPWRGPSEYEATATVRSRFGAAVMLLLTDLLWRERLVRKDRLISRAWPHTTGSRGTHG
jgi:DNA-binding MltR family transcriptional regulator